jgi:hypothetical protein
MTGAAAIRDRHGAGGAVAFASSNHRDVEGTMPAKTEKQRKFMGAELQRKREGKETRTDMSEAELEKMASKPKGAKKRDD